MDAPTGESERFNAGPADDLIWGRHAAQAALESDRPIHRIWCTPEMRFQPRFMQLLREAKSGGVLVSRSDDFFFAYYGHTDIRGCVPIDAGPAAAIKALAERFAALGVEVRSALDREPDGDPGPDADE